MAPMNSNFEAVHIVHERGDVVIVRAGFTGTERIVPPAGEDHAFKYAKWKRTVETFCAGLG